MKAAACAAYGGPEVVRIVEVPVPVPRDDEVLIRIAAASVSTADWRLRSLAVPTGMRTMVRLACGFTRPRRPVLGTELSGIVVETGRAVTRFAPGDAVVAYPGAGLGCHAEFRAMRESGAIIRKPAALTHEEAAAMSFGGTTALAFLRDKGRLGPADRVLVIGASGSVGSAAVQIARHLGAEVAAVCSGKNLEFVRGLGAHRVIDYERADFADGGERYDIILDAVGATTFEHARCALAPEGRFLMVVAGLPQMFEALMSMPRRQKAIAGVVGERREDMEFLAGLAQAGAWRPAIERAYALEEIAAAHARVESGRKRGNVVVSFPGSSDGE